MTDQSSSVPHEYVEPPVSVAKVVHTLAAYRAAIGLSLAAAAAIFLVIAALLYVLAPRQRLTTLPFRLEFAGAETGRYPNGMRFSGAEIVNTPILIRVFQENELSRFTTLPAFSRAIFVAESNRAYEALAAEYQARLSDARLTAVDRERIQREYEQKRASLSKNEYALHFLRTSETAKIPEPVVHKVLANVLSAWAAYAMTEQQVLSHRVAVLSPAVVDAGLAESGDLLIGLQILRSRLLRILTNIDEISELPAADLARTSRERISLSEVRLRLEDLLRFRVEPLGPLIVRSGLVSDPVATVSFLENQLSFDERRLMAQQERAAAMRDTLAVYSNVGRPTAAEPRAAQESRTAPPSSDSGEMLMPQLSESFLDRVVAMASSASDAEYRQRLAEAYREASLNTIPLEQAVSYDREILREIRAGGGGGRRVDASVVAAQLAAIRAEARQLVGDVNEVYRAVSRNLNPSTQLYSQTASVTTRTTRAVDVRRLAVYGLLVLLLTLIGAVIGSLLHNRVREEDAVARPPHGA